MKCDIKKHDNNKKASEISYKKIPKYYVYIPSRHLRNLESKNAMNYNKKKLIK